MHKTSLKHIERQLEEIERGGLGENRQKYLSRTVTPFSTVLGAWRPQGEWELGQDLGTEKGPGKG